MKKKLLFILIPAALLCAVLTAIIINKSVGKSNINTIVIQSNIQTYESEAELAKDSDLIVYGTVETTLDQDKAYVKYTGNSLIDYYTVTPFVIRKVLYGSFDEKYVNVIQAVAIDDNGHGEKNKYIDEGYEELNKDCLYILYLKKLDEEATARLGDDTYGILGVYYGKIDLDDDSASAAAMSTQNGYISDLDRIRQGVLDRFGDEIAEYMH